MQDNQHNDDHLDGARHVIKYNVEQLHNVIHVFDNDDLGTHHHHGPGDDDILIHNHEHAGNHDHVVHGDEYSPSDHVHPDLQAG